MGPAFDSAALDNRGRPGFGALLVTNGGVWATLILGPVVVVAPFIQFSGPGATIAAAILVSILLLFLAWQVHYLYVLANRGTLGRGSLIEVKSVGSGESREWRAKYAYERRGENFTLSNNVLFRFAARREVLILLDPQHPKSAMVLPWVLSRHSPPASPQSTASSSASAGEPPKTNAAPWPDADADSSFASPVMRLLDQAILGTDVQRREDLEEDRRRIQQLENEIYGPQEGKADSSS